MGQRWESESLTAWDTREWRRGLTRERRADGSFKEFCFLGQRGRKGVIATGEGGGGRGGRAQAGSVFLGSGISSNVLGHRERPSAEGNVVTQERGGGASVGGGGLAEPQGVQSRELAGEGRGRADPGQTLGVCFLREQECFFSPSESVVAKSNDTDSS